MALTLADACVRRYGIYRSIPCQSGMRGAGLRVPAMIASLALVSEKVPRLGDKHTSQASMRKQNLSPEDCQKGSREVRRSSVAHQKRYG